MSDSHSIELSIVILGYGEEDRLPAFVATVASEVGKIGAPYEIILVANYWPNTPDRTPQVAADLARGSDRIQVVARPKEGMMGWDMRSGLERARGRILAVIDGDGQFPPRDIVRLYHVLLDQGLDFCQTHRIKRADGWERRFTSKVYNLLFTLLFPGTGMRDINGKPKLMTRALYQSFHLTSDDWFIDAEMVIQARRLGCRMGQVYSVFGDRASKSYVSKSTILEFFKNLAQFWVRDLACRIKKTFRG